MNETDLRGSTQVKKISHTHTTELLVVLVLCLTVLLCGAIIMFVLLLFHALQLCYVCLIQNRAVMLIYKQSFLNGAEQIVKRSVVQSWE